MIEGSAGAISPQPSLGRIGPWFGTGVGSESESSTDAFTTTGAGRIADLIVLTIDGSGMRELYFIEYRRMNDRSITLMQKWIDEYDDDLDPNLDEQVKELQENGLLFR